MHNCPQHLLDRVRKRKQQLIAEDEASLSPSKRSREEEEETQPPAKKGPMDSFTVSAAQEQQFHRLMAIHLICKEAPFTQVCKKCTHACMHLRCSHAHACMHATQALAYMCIHLHVQATTCPW